MKGSFAKGYRRSSGNPNRTYTKKDLKNHILTYIVVCAVLVIINVAVNRTNLWSLWIVFLWGVAILIEWVLIWKSGRFEKINAINSTQERKNS